LWVVRRTVVQKKKDGLHLQVSAGGKRGWEKEKVRVKCLATGPKTAIRE